MHFEHAVWVHIAFGSLALALYWRSHWTRKGSAAHRRSGRTFFVVLLGTVVTVGPVVLMRPEPFDPGRPVSLVYLSLCVVSIVTVGWTAIRWKTAPERFRGPHLRVLGPTIAVLGAATLAAGLASGDEVAAVLSWVGLAYGTAMTHFAWSRAPLHPRWWLAWHLNAVCGLFTAVHGTLLFVAWRRLFAPEAAQGDAVVWHVGVLLAAIALRAVWGRRLRVPWGFYASVPSRPGSAAPSAGSAPASGST